MNRHTARWLGLMSVLAVGAAVHAADGPAERLAAARAALGGDRLLSATSTFAIRGTQQIDTHVVHRSAPFEIDCQLPDRFVWREQGGGQRVTVLGFVGSKLISNSPQESNLLVPGTAQPGRPASTRPATVPDDQQRLVAKSQFTVITLGLLASSLGGHTLHFAELPGANANSAAIGVTSDDGFGATLIFDPKTHLPDRVLYGVKTADATYISEWLYGDYRDVEGRRVPFRFSYATGNDPTHLESRWVYQAETVRFNLALDPETFRVR